MYSPPTLRSERHTCTSESWIWFTAEVVNISSWKLCTHFCNHGCLCSSLLRSSFLILEILIYLIALINALHYNSLSLLFFSNSSVQNAFVEQSCFVTFTWEVRLRKEAGFKEEACFSSWVSYFNNAFSKEVRGCLHKSVTSSHDSDWIT